jgi:PAS domain S-box-containing protein
MNEKTSSLVFLQYLTTVFDNITDGILLINVEANDHFTLAMANKRFFEFSGYPDDSIDKEISEIVGPEAYGFLQRQYKKVVRSKTPLEYLKWSDVPAGLRAFEVRLVPILSTTGNCVVIAALIHDATEREQLKSEVEKLRATVRGIRQS